MSVNVRPPETIAEAAERLVRVQRAEQGLPPLIEDDAALAWLAERLHEVDAPPPAALRRKTA